ncbi:hypothetical protein ISN74_09640 [Dyella caseinilytica]|uniref:Uncharacterized protein n=1 Tax=Dyella caseinilytica TaxID=1849581 RepID=A0ABX7GZB5_9GAMM|nr:hypothetical protein ISN74_09640 [Dyella caseinilytica]
MVLALHVLFALMLWSAMQSKSQHLAVVPVDGDQMLIVHLPDDTHMPRAAPPPAPPTLPELVPPQQAAPSRLRPVSHEKPRPDAMVVQDHEAAPAPATSVASPAASSLFAQDGSIRLPPSLTNIPIPTSAGTKPAKPTDDSQIMRHDINPMHFKPTRFDKYFPPPNETAGGAVGRHIGDAIQAITKSMCDPTKRSTATNLLCGAPPLPPSPKDRDERLNLPSSSLAGDTQPIKPMPLSTCIAEYNDGKPLSYGCPINTPDLAFQAEMRECIDLFRAGKRLKTWCPADTPKRAAAESSTPAASSSVGSH